MPGISDLHRLLRNLSPILNEASYVFCTLEEGRYGDMAELEPTASFMEQEGLTLVLKEAQAQAAELRYEGTFRCITLQVHSSLLAVGLTAAVSTEFANHGISANIIAAYHHDHVFVPSKDANRALELLKAL